MHWSRCVYKLVCASVLLVLETYDLADISGSVETEFHEQALAVVKSIPEFESLVAIQCGAPLEGIQTREGFCQGSCYLLHTHTHATG